MFVPRAVQCVRVSPGLYLRSGNGQPHRYRAPIGQCIAPSSKWCPQAKTQPAAPHPQSSSSMRTTRGSEAQKTLMLEANSWVAIVHTRRNAQGPEDPNLPDPSDAFVPVWGDSGTVVEKSFSNQKVASSIPLSKTLNP